MATSAAAAFQATSRGALAAKGKGWWCQIHASTRAFARKESRSVSHSAGQTAVVFAGPAILHREAAAPGGQGPNPKPYLVMHAPQNPGPSARGMLLQQAAGGQTLEGEAATEATAHLEACAHTRVCVWVGGGRGPNLVNSVPLPRCRRPSARRGVVLLSPAFLSAWGAPPSMVSPPPLPALD